MQNKDKLINTLIAQYPSHGFVIDYEEAKEIFTNVKWVDSDEAKLEVLLINHVKREQENAFIVDLYNEIVEDDAFEKEVVNEDSDFQKDDVEEAKITPDEFSENDTKANANALAINSKPTSNKIVTNIKEFNNTFAESNLKNTLKAKNGKSKEHNFKQH